MKTKFTGDDKRSKQTRVSGFAKGEIMPEQNPFFIPMTEMNKYFQEEIDDDGYFEILRIHVGILMKKGMSRVDALEYILRCIQIISVYRKKPNEI